MLESIDLLGASDQLLRFRRKNQFGFLNYHSQLFFVIIAVNYQYQKNNYQFLCQVMLILVKKVILLIITQVGNIQNVQNVIETLPEKPIHLILFLNQVGTLQDLQT